jgi:hypothetical protein
MLPNSSLGYFERPGSLYWETYSSAINKKAAQTFLLMVRMDSMDALLALPPQNGPVAVVPA